MFVPQRRFNGSDFCSELYAQPRQRLQLPELSKVVAGTRDQAHHTRAARPARASYEASRKAAEFRHHDLREAQRSREVRKQAQVVARDSHSLREAGRELPGSGGNRCADDLVGLMNRQSHPSKCGYQ